MGAQVGGVFGWWAECSFGEVAFVLRTVLYWVVGWVAAWEEASGGDMGGGLGGRLGRVLCGGLGDVVGRVVRTLSCMGAALRFICVGWWVGWAIRGGVCWRVGWFVGWVVLSGVLLDVASMRSGVLSDCTLRLTRIVYCFQCPTHHAQHFSTANRCCGSELCTPALASFTTGA